MMRYEDLREDPAAEIERLAAFLGISVKPARINEIVQLTTLERLKSQQIYDDPRKKHTLQSGSVGGWRERLTEQQVRIFEGLSSVAMTALGYELTTVWPGGTTKTPTERHVAS